MGKTQAQKERIMRIIGKALAGLGLLAVVTGSSVASAATINIMTASVGGNYNKVICPAIVKHIAKAGVVGKCVPSAGTGANFDAVYENGATTVALGQMDGNGLKQLGYGIEDADERAEFVEGAEEAMGAVGFVVGESLFCAAKKGGRVPQQASWSILNDDEKMEKPFKISTYDENSGPGLSLAFLRQSFPNFAANTKIKNKKKFKFEVEIGRMRAGKRDMVCWVTMANPEDNRLKSVTSAEDLFLVPFDSPELASVKIGKVPAYIITDVMVTGSLWNLVGGGETVRTITTGVTVIINVEELDDKVYNALVAAVNDPDLLPADGFVAKLMKAQRKAMGAMADAYKATMKVAEKATGG